MSMVFRIQNVKGWILNRQFIKAIIQWKFRNSNPHSFVFKYDFENCLNYNEHSECDFQTQINWKFQKQSMLWYRISSHMFRIQIDFNFNSFSYYCISCHIFYMNLNLQGFEINSECSLYYSLYLYYIFCTIFIFFFYIHS